MHRFPHLPKPDAWPAKQVQITLYPILVLTQGGVSRMLWRKYKATLQLVPAFLKYLRGRKGWSVSHRRGFFIRYVASIIQLLICPREVLRAADCDRP